MNRMRPSYLFSLLISCALLISPLPLVAIADELASHISTYDKAIINKTPQDSYICLGKDLSSIAELANKISDLDSNSNSPIHRLNNHIKNGYTIGLQETVIEALVYAENYLKKTNNSDHTNLTAELETVTNQIANGTLTITAESLQAIAAKKDTNAGKRVFTHIAAVKGLLSVNDQLVQNITAVNLSATDTIIQNSTIGTVSATDAVIQNINITNISVVDATAITLSATDAIIDDLTVINCVTNLCINNLSVVEGSISGTLSANDAVIKNYARFNDTAGGEYIGLQAPSVVPTSYTLSLPSNAPTSHQVLRANGTTPTNLEWVTEGGAVTPTASKTIYVTKYGNDTTGDGSFATPYLTLTKAIDIANGIATVSNPIAIVMSSGIYVEDNSVSPLIITAAGISIVGESSSSVIVRPNTPANDLLLINDTVRIASMTFASTSPLGTGISLTAGTLSVLNNVRINNFLVGINCAGGATESYGLNSCLFVDNVTALNINDTRVESNSCSFFGTSSPTGPAANTGINITGAAASLVANGGVCALCVNGINITNNALATISSVGFRLNTFDITQDGASHMTLSGCNFELSNGTSDIDVQVSGAGTIAEIISCEFNGLSTSSVAEGTGLAVTDDGLVNISGGIIHNYTTGIQVGATTDVFSTVLIGSGIIIQNCTTDILQQGSATLSFSASTAYNSKITINDSTNVELAFFNLDDNGALTIGSTADQDTTLLQANINASNHPSINYDSSLYSTQAIGFDNTELTGPSSWFILSNDNANLTGITTDRTKTSGLRLVSDEGSPVGGTSALRGWDINKNASTGALSFAYQNTDTVGQISVPQYTVMQLDGFNNQVQLPTAATQIVFGGDTNLYRDSANVLKTDDNFIVGTLTPDRVVVTAAGTNQLTSSAVTGTELGYLSGVTSSIQTQINGKVAKAGDIMTGTLQLPAGTTAAPSLVFTGSTTTGLSAPVANSLSLSTNAVEHLNINSTGAIAINAFSTAGVVHNNASGVLSSSLIVDADITNATISNAKLATISSTDVPGSIVVRDGSGNFATNMITIDGTVTNPTDTATKAYVDAAIATGLVAKTPALVVSTTDVALTGLQTIDGVLLVANDRVLLVGQTDPIENGLWLAQSGAWTRPADFATGSTVGQAYVLITSGTANAGSSWLSSTPLAVVDTDPIMFVLFSLPNSTTGANVGTGTGLVFKNKTGATLNFRTLLAGTHMSVTTNTDDITIATDATNANTASTIVARDASGNFSAGTITANLTGSASNNVLKAGDTMTGSLQLPAGTTLAPSLIFTGSTTTGLSAASDNLSFSTAATERMKISDTGVVSINSFSTAGVVHNDSSGNLSSSLIVNDDVSASAAIVDTKLATISTSGKVANTATTATALNTASAIVARDASGNFAAGTITASLTGSASNNVLKAGDTMTGTLQLPAGTTALPSLVFTGSTTTGLSASGDDLSLSTSGAERLKIAAGGSISVNAFTVPGIVHNDALGDLSSSLIVNADIDANAAIIDTKLATISTAGKVANSATTATSSNTASAIVLRDPSGNFSASRVSLTDAVIQNLTVTNCVASLCVVALSATDQSVSGTLSVNDEIVQNSTIITLSVTDAIIQNVDIGTVSITDATIGTLSATDAVINGSVQLSALTPAGVVHNSASGVLSTSLIVNADITNATITNAKLAAISSTNTADNIVVRDGSGNFATTMITLSGTTTNPTDAATKSYVDGAITATGTNLNTANTLVKRDSTGSFAAEEISMVDGIISNNLILSTEPSTSTAGNILKGSSSFIHDFGTNNTFVGISAGNFTTSGTGANSGFGASALNANTTGNNNTALGYQALSINTTGSNNIAIGYQAGDTLVSGNNNIYINADAATAGENSTTRIGTSQTSCFIAGIVDAGVSGDVVVVDANGQLGITLSSRRFKHDIQDMNEISEKIFKLRPVTFAYNSDTTETMQYGLIAEEVEEVFPEIVARNENGIPYTVRYHLLPILLLNEIQKQQASIETMKKEYVSVETMNDAIDKIKLELQNFMQQVTNSQK